MLISSTHASRFSSRRLPSIIQCSFLLLINLSLITCTLVAQERPEVTALELGKPIERELAGESAHSYSIRLAANQFLHIVVEQKGIDVVVTMFAPDGTKLAEVDSPNGTEGPEPIVIIADFAGDYRLEVRSLDKNAVAGRYQVKIEEIRAAQPQDKSRIAANQAFAEAEQLFYQGSAESRRKAIDKFQEALLLLRVINDSAKEAETLDRIAMVYEKFGDKDKALAYYNQALSLFRAIGDRRGEAYALDGIGYIYNTLGQNQKALVNINQALALFRLVGDRAGEANALTVIGSIYKDLGEKQRALDYLNQALPHRRAIGDPRGEANTLGAIGLVFDSLGEKKKALDYFNQALPLWRAAGDPGGEAIALVNIGFSYNSLGEHQKALTNLLLALQLLRTIGDRAGEAVALNNIGFAYNALGEQQKALDRYREALPLRRAAGDRNGEANALNNIGGVYFSLGEKEKAFDYYTQALPLFRGVGDRDGEADALYNLARVERDRNNLAAARVRIEDALSIVESLRANIASQELRSSYFATVQEYYFLYIDILMRLHKEQPSSGFDGEALRASERGRARSLLETLAEANADIRQGVDATLVERERTLQQQLNAKAQAQMKLLNGQHTDAQAATMAKEIEALTTEYQQVEAEIRQKSPNYAALTQPKPLSLKEIQTEVLDKDTLLLEYSLGDEHSYLWAVTQNSVTSYELPKRDEIETQAREVYALVVDPKRWKAGDVAGQKQLTMEVDRAGTSRDALKRLSQMLLLPVAAQLSNKRLLVIAEGALQYIPFGALPAPVVSATRRQAKTYHPLIIDHEIASLPSASTLAVLRQEVKDRKPAAKSVAVLADPVFESDDERITHANIGTDVGSRDSTATTQMRELPLGLERSLGESGLRDIDVKIPRLPGTRIEARQILTLVSPMQRKEAFDFAANRQAATSDDLSQYRYVHFATHGFLNSVHPELSGLVFSMVDEKGKPQDGFLRANEIFNLKLPAELVVLSACQTGLGKEIKGEGLVGLTRGFMYAGSPRVVVSLWSVSDQATAELMTRFYRGMLKDNMRPAAALRAAQVSLMKEPRWQSPYYWAAFTLQGEWR